MRWDKKRVPRRSNIDNGDENGLPASFFNRNVGSINSDVCGLYGPRLTGLPCLPLAERKKGRECAYYLYEQAIYIPRLKKNGNNGDNGLTYGRRGYEVVVF